ncbi:hypothetical protein VNO80_17605 [Phaseolus coccineus]|uniref:Uncharacterized protein n=1 Tax=Phaseolus coccineus TaxID=3886 RepID=A0AAN9QY30_PHACN
MRTKLEAVRYLLRKDEKERGKVKRGEKRSGVVKQGREEKKGVRERDEIRSGLDLDHTSNPKIYSHIHIHVSTWVPPTFVTLNPYSTLVSPRVTLTTAVCIFVG